MAIELQRYTPRPDEQCGIAAFIDVETTGLSTRFDEVVEFAIALFAFDRTTGQIKGIIDEYVGLRDPGRSIPADARRVHRISDSDVEGKRLDGEQILRLIDWAEFLVAHNLSFDRPFVERQYIRKPSARPGCVPKMTSRGDRWGSRRESCRIC